MLACAKCRCGCAVEYSPGTARFEPHPEDNTSRRWKREVKKGSRRGKPEGTAGPQAGGAIQANSGGLTSSGMKCEVRRSRVPGLGEGATEGRARGRCLRPETTLTHGRRYVPVKRLSSDGPTSLHIHLGPRLPAQVGPGKVAWLFGLRRRQQTAEGQGYVPPAKPHRRQPCK